MKHTIEDPHKGMAQRKLVNGNRFTFAWVPESKSDIGCEQTIEGLDGTWTVVEWK